MMRHKASKMEPGGVYRMALAGGQPFEFSRFNDSGDAIVHPPGEPDMQSSWIVPREAYVVPAPRKKDMPCCQFGLTKKQKLAIDKWCKSLHRSKKPYYGRNIEYIFQSNGIGTGLTVRDIKTGKTKDFTDYDVW